MENVSHNGKGKFGYVTKFKNGQINYSWFRTESDRDKSFEGSRKIMTNKLSVVKINK